MAVSLSPDERNVVADLGAEVGRSVVASGRPYAVACPDKACGAPLGTCCLTGSGVVRDEPHMARVRLSERRYRRI